MSCNVYYVHACSYFRVGNSLISFLSDSLIFCKRKSDSLVKTSKLLPLLLCRERHEQIAHGHSFVKSDGSKSLKSLFKKERMSKEQQELFALGHKRGKTVKNIRKIRIFLGIRSFIASDLLVESRANHSNGSFLKSELLTVAL